jgi:hypothetical protein
MEYCSNNDTIETILTYPAERLNKTMFPTEALFDDFIMNIKRFAFPYRKTLKQSEGLKRKTGKNSNEQRSSSLVQFYTFVFTDINRIRQYGFCRSSQNGDHILCIVSHLPWYNVFINLLNKIAMIINEKETASLYHFLEAVYEYELPDPGNYAQIFSHDGLDQIRFQCTDRRIVPSINENRHLLKFFAFFDLDKLIKIFTGLLLERRLLIVSRDLENLTSCALALEALIYPLEWFHTFAPIMPEHIDLLAFNQPFPYIYGIHTCLYEKLTSDQLTEPIILLIDDKQVLNGDNDTLPDHISAYLRKKLKFFHDNMSYSMNEGSMVTSGGGGGGGGGGVRLNVDKSDLLLKKGPIQAFQDAVLMIIEDYHDYIKWDSSKMQYQFDEDTFFQLRNVYKNNNDSNNDHPNSFNSNSNNGRKKYISNDNEFFHEFRVTQSFEEFMRDRCEYVKEEDDYSMKNGDGSQMPKDYIQYLVDQYISDNSKFQQFLVIFLLKFVFIKN